MFERPIEVSLRVILVDVPGCISVINANCNPLLLPEVPVDPINDLDEAFKLVLTERFRRIKQ